MIEINLLLNGSINFISNYLINNLLECMILIINGIIDSTFAVILCSKVDKKTNTKSIWVFLMCSTNKQDEWLYQILYVKHFVMNIIKKKNPYEILPEFCKNSSAINGMSTKISKGNIKASLRMIYLWNLCGFRNGVTIDTDNRTEHELGFFTLMGEQNYINPWLYTSVEDRQKYMN